MRTAALGPLCCAVGVDPAVLVRLQRNCAGALAALASPQWSDWAAESAAGCSGAGVRPRTIARNSLTLSTCCFDCDRGSTSQSKDAAEVASFDATPRAAATTGK